MANIFVNYLNSVSVANNLKITIYENVSDKKETEKGIFGIYREMDGDINYALDNQSKSQILPFSIQVILLGTKEETVNYYKQNVKTLQDLTNSQFLNDEFSNSSIIINYSGGSLSTQVDTQWGKGYIYTLMGSLQITNAFLRTEDAIFKLNNNIIPGLTSANIYIENEIEDDTTLDEFTKSGKVSHTSETLTLNLYIMVSTAQQILTDLVNNNTNRLSVFNVELKWKNIGTVETPVYIYNFTKTYLVKSISSPLIKGSYASMSIVFYRTE